MVSDLGVGLLAQPLYISLLVSWLQHNVQTCITYSGIFIVIGLFSLASFSNVAAISVDRFLAIHLHLRYQELVTHKRVVAVVISIWIFSGLISLIIFWLTTEIALVILCTIGVTCLLLTTVVYWRIYFVLRCLKNQLEALQMQEYHLSARNGDMENFARLRKSAVGAFYVYLVFPFCYLPRVILYIQCNPDITILDITISPI